MNEPSNDGEEINDPKPFDRLYRVVIPIMEVPNDHLNPLGYLIRPLSFVNSFIFRNDTNFHLKKFTFSFS
jgi:hypothetical protein